MPKTGKKEGYEEAQKLRLHTFSNHLGRWTSVERSTGVHGGAGVATERTVCKVGLKGVNQSIRIDEKLPWLRLKSSLYANKIEKVDEGRCARTGNTECLECEKKVGRKRASETIKSVCGQLSGKSLGLLQNEVLQQKKRGFRKERHIRLL